MSLDKKIMNLIGASMIITGLSINAGNKLNIYLTEQNYNSLDNKYKLEENHPEAIDKHFLKEKTEFYNDWRNRGRALTGLGLGIPLFYNGAKYFVKKRRENEE